MKYLIKISIFIIIIVRTDINIMYILIYKFPLNIIINIYINYIYI
jgi:hypothetical protein